MQSVFATGQLLLDPKQSTHNVDDSLHQFDNLILSSALFKQEVYLCSMDCTSAWHLSGMRALTPIRISHKHRITLWKFRIRSPFASCAWSVISPVSSETYLPKHNACNRSYVSPSATYHKKGMKAYDDLPPDLPPLDNLIL